MTAQAAKSRKTDRHVVAVVFEVRPEHLATFRAAILENARTSLQVEPGCLVFDVCEHADSPVFFLYELYEDAAAFDEHLRSAHFNSFDALTAGWVIDKRVQRYERLLVASPLTS
jgi:autoinducer 2-degrading protein